MHVALVTGDDWEGLYIDGVIVNETHSIEAGDMMEFIVEAQGKQNRPGDLCPQITYEHVWVDLDWLAEEGSLPAKLEDVKREQR